MDWSGGKLNNSRAGERGGYNKKICPTPCGEKQNENGPDGLRDIRHATGPQTVGEAESGVLAFLERLQAVKSVLVRNRRKDKDFSAEHQIVGAIFGASEVTTTFFFPRGIHTRPKCGGFSVVTHRKTVYLHSHTTQKRQNGTRRRFQENRITLQRVRFCVPFQRNLRRSRRRLRLWSARC